MGITKAQFKTASILLVAGLVAAACSSGGTSSPTAGTSATSEVTSTGTPAPESTSTSGEPQSGGTITVALSLAPSSLDPIMGSSGGDQMSYYPIFDRLVNFDPETLAPVPGLAKSWTWKDETTLVLDLQDGVTFQDGTAFDAEAVKFNIDRARSAEGSKEAANLASISAVDVTGPLAVTITLSKPDSSIVLVLADRAGMMVSPTAAADSAAFAQHPVGTGPYSFVSYTSNDTMVLQKNPSYWQAGKPYLDGITFKYFTDQQTASNALQGGQADVLLNVDLASVATLQKATGIDVAVENSLLTDGCYFNTLIPPFDKLEARQAIPLAIDRDALNNSYAFGLATPTNSVFPFGYWANDDTLAADFSHDPDQAKQLLASADAASPTIKAITFQDTGEIRKMEIMQEQLKAVGITMTFDVFDAATVAANFFTKDNTTYNMACASWSGRPDPSQTANSLFSSSSFYNVGGVAYPGMDDALAAAAAGQTQEERATAFSDIIRINQEQVIWMPTLSEINATAYRDRIQGLTTNLYGKIDTSFLWVND